MQVRDGQCEGLNAGMGAKVETPMPFLFPYKITIEGFLVVGTSPNWSLIDIRW